MRRRAERCRYRQPWQRRRRACRTRSSLFKDGFPAINRESCAAATGRYGDLSIASPMRRSQLCADEARSVPVRGQPDLDIVFARKRALDAACDLHVLLSLETKFSTLRGGNCDRLAGTPVFVWPADCSRLMSNRATNSAIASHTKSPVARAGQDEGSWCRKLCKKVVTPCRPSDQEDLCDDDTELHLVATCA